MLVCKLIAYNTNVHPYKLQTFIESGHFMDQRFDKQNEKRNGSLDRIGEYCKKYVQRNYYGITFSCE